jgi:hypothetical protein
MSAEFAPARVSVGVICMTSADHVIRCLTSLRAQEHAPAFDVTVVCDPDIPGIETCRERFPDHRFTINEGQSSTLQLVSRVLHECQGELILLTKDHCVPDRGWVRTLVDAQAPGRAAVGGRVESAPGASAAAWAFHFIDFYPYVAPVDEGPASSLTVCNVSYQRKQLEAICDLWRDTFVETVINSALASRFGDLWLHPASVVTLHRHVTLREGVYERYFFGRVFGYSRIAGGDIGRRLLYALFAPALPVLLLGRLMRAAMRSTHHTRAFVRGFIPLALMVLGRSYGEWLAYVTGRPPHSAKSSA